MHDDCIFFFLSVYIYEFNKAKKKFIGHLRSALCII